MSGAVQQERPRTAVPLPDLKVIDEALAGGDDALKEAVKTVRPADLGRDLSRRPMDAGRRILQAVEDRRGAAMLVAAHPAVAARLLASLEIQHAVRLLAFMPTEHQVAVLGQMETDDRMRIEQALPPDDKQTIDRLLAEGLYIGGDVQFIVNPGYNRARPGPRLRHPRPSGILTLKMTQSPVPAARR